MVTDSCNDGRFSRYSMLCVVLLLVGFWLVLWPYRGLVHDSRLYTVEALKILYPENFRNEIFLMFGSQGSYTLYPRLYAWLIAIFGVEKSAFALTLLGKALWVICFLRLVFVGLKGWTGVFALLLLCLHSTTYDYYSVFSYFESFATPRIFAEALVLASAAEACSKRLVSSALLCLAALLLHPLMSLAFVPVLAMICYFGGNRVTRKWLIVALVCAGLLGLLLAFSGMRPFADFLLNFDAQWREVALARFPNILPEDWEWRHAGIVGSYFFLVLLAATRFNGVYKRLFLSALIVGLVAIGVWVLGAGLIHNVLVTQLQPWRCIWFVQVFSCIAMAMLLGDSIRQGAPGWLEASFLFAGFVFEAWTSLACMFAAVVLGRLTASFSVSSKIKPRTLRLVAVVIGASAAIMAFYRIQTDLATIGPISSVVVPVFGAGGLVVFFVLRKVDENLLRDDLRYWCAVSVSVALLVIATVVWSTAFPNTFIQEDEGKEGRELLDLRAAIPAQSVILSDFGARWVWTRLQRSHYVSDMQLAGTVFSRQTALEGFRRMHRLLEASFPGAKIGWNTEALEMPASGRISRQSIDYLCEDFALDYLVLAGEYTEGRFFLLKPKIVVSLISCADIRRWRLVKIDNKNIERFL